MTNEELISAEFETFVRGPKGDTGRGIEEIPEQIQAMINATGSANDAATQASAAAKAANTATTNANTATANANTATANANAAEENANSAASGANSAAGSANSAASAANTAAGSANTAASAANTAASAANSAASSAQTATANANAATQASKTQQEAVAKAEAARDTAEQERTTAEQARQETFAGYEERLVAATPDDTTVNGRAWTSKKTVDSLCLPFEASGNPVQVYPVEGYPLGVRVGWEPVQAGEGDPSPDNVRPITGLDALSLTRCGKNLVRHKYAPGYTETIKGLTYVVNDDYSVTVTGTCTDETYYNFYSINNSKLVPYTIDAMGRTVTNNGFTIRDVVAQPHAVDGTRLYLVFLAGKTVDKTYYPMLTYGDGTDYEPYTGSTTDIALPETVYGGTLDVETGVVTVDRGITIADGTTNKFNSGVTWDLPWRTSPGIIGVYWPDTWIISSHFKGNLFSSNETYEFIFTSPEKMSGMFATVDELNAYLVEQNAAGTPVTFVYKLANPYTIQLTPQQIAALSGVNTLYTDAGTLTVTGREDPRHTIVTLTDRIAALESAAAGV